MRRESAVVGGNGERGAVEEMGEEAAAEGRRAAGGKRAAGERGGRAAPRGKTGKGEREPFSPVWQRQRLMKGDMSKYRFAHLSS